MGFWLVGDYARLPSPHLRMNELSPFPSHPASLIVKPDEAVVVCSLAAAFAPVVAGHRAQPSSRTHGNDTIHYMVMGWLCLHQPAIRSATLMSKTLRVQGTDWGIDMDEGRDGVIERTKVVGDERG